MLLSTERDGREDMTSKKWLSCRHVKQLM